jgi:hypothetical protein
MRGYGAPHILKLGISLQPVASKIKMELSLFSKQSVTVKEQVNSEVQLHAFLTASVV